MSQYPDQSRVPVEERAAYGATLEGPFSSALSLINQASELVSVSNDESEEEKQKFRGQPVVKRKAPRNWMLFVTRSQLDDIKLMYRKSINFGKT